MEIYQSCRTEGEINSAFDRLQQELSEQINQKMVETRGKLLEHFDDEVRARFKIINKRIKEDLSAIDMILARFIISALNIRNYEMKESSCNLQIDSMPVNFSGAPKDRLKPGHYYIGRHDENIDSERIHIGHPITKAVIQNIKNSQSDKVYAVKLCYSRGKHKISQLEPYVGKKGVWLIYKITYEGLDTEEHILHSVFVKDNSGWLSLDQELSQKFPNIMAEEIDFNEEIGLPDENALDAAMSGVLSKLAEKISIKNEGYYDAEFDKLELYSEEVLMRLYDELKEKEEEIKNTKRIKDRAMTFEDRQKARKEIHKLELAYGHLVDKVAQEKKRLFEEKDKEMKKLEKKLNLKIQKTCIARALWTIE